MSEGSREAVRVDDAVVATYKVRRLEERVRELERLLGRKTSDVEILKEALELARTKNRPCCRPRRCRGYPAKTVSSAPSRGFPISPVARPSRNPVRIT